MMRSTSLSICSHAWSPFCLPSSTRLMASRMAVWMSPARGPWCCGFRLSAAVVKILPIGASSKNAWVSPVTSGLP